MDDSKRNKYLIQTYGITLEQYNKILDVQGGVCAICGRKPREGKNLAVDHRHFKVHTENIGHKQWAAYVELSSMRQLAILGTFPTKSLAIKSSKKIAMPKSIRGILCHGKHRTCNYMLGRVDDVNWLRGALNYVTNPPARKILEN